MKKIYTILGLFSTFILAYSQITVAANPDLVGNSKNTFIDATEFTNLANSSAAKGLNFPRTNLTTFTFNTTDLGQYQYSKTAFDGMVVYNTGTGQTGANVSTQGQRVTVEPGFYYFSNPTATEDNTDVSTGKWIRIGGADAAALAGQFWAINGNTGVPAANAKIGTTDAVPVQMISNGQTIQTFGASSNDANFRKVVINPNASANVTMAKNKTVGGTGFDFALEVGGKGWFENGIVTSNSTYPDYVFDNYFTGKSEVNPNYQFKKLNEVETFIKENNHLPGVTKIDDLAKGGNGYMIDQTQLSIQTLEKVEELYLHVIEQQKEIQALKAEIAKLKK